MRSVTSAKGTAGAFVFIGASVFTLSTAVPKEQVDETWNAVMVIHLFLLMAGVASLCALKWRSSKPMSILAGLSNLGVAVAGVTLVFVGPPEVREVRLILGFFFIGGSVLIVTTILQGMKPPARGAGRPPALPGGTNHTQ